MLTYSLLCPSAHVLSFCRGLRSLVSPKGRILHQLGWDVLMEIFKHAIII